ncbi:MAG: alpha-glucosidase [bacterium]|nr:alpha-glucosidase [bacterium]
MTKNHPWWKTGIIYQIYPRSFNDSNGDGIGDIPGIIEKLDYLQDLGVNGIWLSPIYESPMFDFGYDISNYRVIDPAFGTMDDFKRLVSEAHARGIRIIMDLVLNHTSSLHPWFLESRSSRDNPKRDWYIWADKKNNWMAAFGGGAWEWDKTTEQYYLHLFLKEQPDLNWRNPEVKQAVFDDIRFWLNLGVDGFRLDVINYIIKDREFRNNPYANFAGYPRRHDMQWHNYDRNQPETHDILKEFRTLMDEFGETMLVGEIYPNEGRMEPGITASYLGDGEDELHLAFDFSPVYAKFKAADFRKLLSRWYGSIPEKGWPCHVLSNHDQVRSMSRLAKGSIEKARILAAMILTQRGTPFLYYGDEIGMRDGKIGKKDLVDPVGKKYWPFHPGRDPQRTPMQWDDSEYAGFSSINRGNSSKPWLPVNSDYRTVNVELQERDEDSLLNFYRQLMALRREHEALHSGGFRMAASDKDVLSYFRRGDSGEIFIGLNFSRKARMCRLEDPEKWVVLFGTHRAAGERIDAELRLVGFEVLVLESLTSNLLLDRNHTIFYLSI